MTSTFSFQPVSENGIDPSHERNGAVDEEEEKGGHLNIQGVENKETHSNIQEEGRLNILQEIQNQSQELHILQQDDDGEEHGAFWKEALPEPTSTQQTVIHNTGTHNTTQQHTTTQNTTTTHTDTQQTESHNTTAQRTDTQHTNSHNTTTQRTTPQNEPVCLTWRIENSTPREDQVRVLPLADVEGKGHKGGHKIQQDEHKIRSMKKKFNCKDLVLKSTLGTGTFGRVVLTQHQPSHTYFALKVLEIKQVVKLKQIQHVKNEKSILLTLSHPFIVRMYWSSHTSSHLYMLMEYVCGGELFTYLRNAGLFPNDIALFYTTEILLVLEYMHHHHLIYRDLKPENLLLDKQGHLKITDFGFAKRLDDRSWTLCGTPEYLAPEIIQNKGHNKAVDWWALGILVYEMLTGCPPFYDEVPTRIYEKILGGSIDFPKHVDSSARDLIRKLLSRDRTRRLGNMKNGSLDVKNHKWFRRIVWTDVLEKKLQPPIVPRVRHTGDTRNFFDYPEENCKNHQLLLPSTDSKEIISTQDHLFDDF